MMRPSAKTLVLDLLGTLPAGASMPVAALVEAAGLFDVPQNNVRVALVRLCDGGHVARDERGRYRLGGRALPLGRLVRGWRDLDRRTRRWGGGWIGAERGANARALRRPRAVALRRLGFAALEPTLWLRPDNLATSIDELRTDLRTLGLPAADLVFRLHDLDAAAARRACALWNVDALRDAHRVALARLEASASRLPMLADDAAMVESFLVGGAVLRHVVRDPLLPEAICPTEERRALVAALRDYDRVGRAAWATLLRRHDVPCLRTPVDAGMDSRVAHAG